MPKKCRIENTPREVIQGKLLAALNDETKVAALLEVEDLDMLIHALYFYNRHHTPCNPNKPKVESFLEDLRTLRRQAFGPP
jgi:hypothetical protein